MGFVPSPQSTANIIADSAPTQSFKTLDLNSSVPIGHYFIVLVKDSLTIAVLCFLLGWIYRKYIKKIGSFNENSDQSN